MFLFNTLFVIFCIYWLSALIAEIVLISKEELTLSPLIRVGFGFLISLVYFSAAGLILSMQQAWVLGAGLLIFYAIGQGIRLKIARLKDYLKSFIFCLLGVSIFFAPLIISNNYGPFTEGGGDISIYSDTAQYVTNHHLNEFGLSDKNNHDLIRNIKESFSPIPLEKRWSSFDHTLINPPAAEYATYRVILKRTMSTFIYTPYAAYGILSKDTNYPTYFGLQAFLYVCMLAGVWYFFRKFNMLMANLALLTVLASHSLISVFYNMYAMQATSITISALILAILCEVRLFSAAGLRLYGSAFILLFLSYILYFSVVLPVVIGVTFFGFTKSIRTHYFKNKKFSFITILTTLVFISLCSLAVWAGTDYSWRFLQSLLLLSFVQDTNIYFGENIGQLSQQGLSFLFGFLSQQHYKPFALESKFVDSFIQIGTIAGILSLFVGMVIILKICRSTLSLDGKKKFYIATYLFILITVIIQSYFGHKSLYFQAKGAQNVLIYLYTLMLLPAGIGFIALKYGLKIKNFLKLLVLFLTVFITSLFATKAVYSAKLLLEEDRGGILGSSFFSSAKKIKNIDKNAFILFEPRKSADLYLSDQAFFGYRMIPMRHLVLQKETLHPSDNMWLGQAVLGSDLIQTEDLSHLWTLNSDCSENKWEWLQTTTCSWEKKEAPPQWRITISKWIKAHKKLHYKSIWANAKNCEAKNVLYNFQYHVLPWIIYSGMNDKQQYAYNKWNNFLNSQCSWKNGYTCKDNFWKKLHAKNCKWHAERLSTRTTPALLLFADNYEKHFSRDILDKTYTFSYLRNGSAMLYLPMGGGEIKATIEPVNETDFNIILTELSERLAKGQFGQYAKLSTTDKLIELTYTLPPTNKPLLQLIAQYSGEYWLNVQLNHDEIT